MRRKCLLLEEEEKIAARALERFCYTEELRMGANLGSI